MHSSSMYEMQRFRDTCVKHTAEGPLEVLDVGGMNMNGSYRSLFPASEGFHYRSLDISPGRGVDIVAEGPYSWVSVESASVDVLVSGQCLEHVQDTHRWIWEAERVLKPGGWICVIAPWRWDEHRCPLDCWRVMPDGMHYLMEEVAGLCAHLTYKNTVGDCVGIAKKRVQQ
jgi:SAM-dependent methyltransferase